MRMRSRKKDIYWGASHRCFPRKLIRGKKVFNTTKFWKAIKLNVTRVFGNDLSIARDWLNTPATALNGARPIDLLNTDNIAALRDHLIKLEYCVYM
ncbi:antitoxin Xre/MbcA/ParS toxin-binding domain-containing protein [Massilia sp. YIM B02763]|uniref:antitoxin Xre/MbcA/ParS toxin-binding domain-containing protein n=1 Tax=Massilia sp. YIM B02763 TaxID=3050130 RepID=UPI0035A6CA4B